MQFTEIGTRRPRVDARAQVTGETCYVGDMHLPGMLYAKGLLSTEHHARLLELDTVEAERLPGVKVVVTARDVPNNNFGQIIPDQFVFADNKVRYRGEVVALVAAETEEIAQEAVELIKVKYERLPAVFDAREAMKPDAPVIHDEAQGVLCQGNVVLAHGHECMRLVHGDVERGFEEAAVVIEHDFATASQRSAAMEPMVSLAKPERTGGLTIWTSTQAPFMIAGILAGVFRMPLNRLRLIVPAVGGGFGGKGAGGLEAMVGVAALKAGRPVRWTMSTGEDFRFATTKAPHHMHFKLGAKRDGTLTAIYRKHIANAGAYGSVAILTTAKATMIGSGPYRIPNQLAESWVVYTNKQPSGAFRGFGISQPTFAIETMMDIMAERLGMDRLELRLKNALQDGDTCGTGQTMHSVGITACLEKVRDMGIW